jgi:hypothetical protein
MSHFRIETVSDPASGMVFAEAYSEPGNKLIVRSEAIFRSHDHAEAEIINMIQRAWPDRNPEAVDASIGV